MSVEIENTPSPSVLMSSMRSIGYSFKTAIADIVDNSISAGANNVYIRVPINDKDLYISILDDGCGMSRDELLNAMRYGSDRVYNKRDLGRFGLGLKSASLSQCKILTVISKKDHVISGFQWDLDIVLKTKKWSCLELESKEIAIVPQVDTLSLMSKGTLVVWQNFDTASKKNEGKIKDYLSEKMEEASSHLSLVFHRYLSNNLHPFNIYINNDPIEAFDPFLEGHPKTDSQPVKELSVNNEIIKVQQIILPHYSDLSNEDIEKLGGMDALRNGQGFYIYRNNRLIVYGNWFKMAVSSELFKYARIKVDIPNSLDDIWEIDVKKQNAVIPKHILNGLKKTVNDVRTRATEKTSRRAKLSFNSDDTKLWSKSLDKNQNECFGINKDSKFIRNFLDDFSDRDKRKLMDFIDVISATIPFEDIYYSVCNKKNVVDIGDEQLNAFAIMGVEQFNKIKSLTQKKDEEALKILTKYEPFNDERIEKRIMEILKNE